MTRWLTRQSVWIMLLLAMAAPAWSQTWPNEPSGSTTLVDCNFSSVTCGGQLVDVYDSGLTGSDAAAPISPPGVLLQQSPAGVPLIGGAQIDYYPPSVSQLYVGFSFSLNSTFGGNDFQENKIVFPGAQWIILQLHGPPGGPFNLGPLLQFSGPNDPDNCHLPGIIAGDCPWGGSGSIKVNTPCVIQRGSGYYRPEIYLQTSTTPTTRDGRLRIHLDGMPCYDELISTPQGAALNQVSINHTWDGAVNKPEGWQGLWEYRFDHVHVSTCSGCSPAPGDQDGDGIPDSSDQCPTIPGPGPTGCPPPTDTIAPMPPDQFEVTRQGGPILPPSAPTGPSSGGDAGFMF